MMRIKPCWMAIALLCAYQERAWPCAVFSAPVTYRMPHALIDFDVGPQALAANSLAHAQFNAATNQAKLLSQAIDQLLLTPNAEHLLQAQAAWRTAKRSYQLTEWTRFAETPIDWAALGARPAGPESRINAWPVNEAVIDAVRGAPNSGLVHRFEVPMTRASILAQDQSGDEADVTTGWHAIEFLLWGQDFNVAGPGKRLAADFSERDQANQRRRVYLKLLVELLIEDLTLVSSEWDPMVEGSYVNKLQQLPAIEQLGRVLHGATTLLITEVYGQRLTVPLDSGSQEDEHSCFSDFTLQDLKADLAGIRSVFFTELKDAPNSSLIALMRWKDPSLAESLQKKFDTATQTLEKIPEPFDQMLLSPPNSPARVQAEAAADALQSLGVSMKAAAETLGIQIVVPGV